MSTQSPGQVPGWDPGTLSETVRREVNRTIQRTVKGLEYLSSGDPGVGLTPKDALYQRGTLTLYHYPPRTEEVYRVPLLLVPSLVSKPYILDLAPGQSLVAFLLERGFDVYLVDWGIPRPEDSRLRLEDYVLDFIPDCAARVLADSAENELSILGYCMGGLLAVLYGALHTDAPLKNLLCLTTPVDYDEMGLLKVWSDPAHFDVDHIVDTLGNVPSEVLQQSFASLGPITKLTEPSKLWDDMLNDDYVTSYRRIDRWANDQIPYPGECFRQTTRDLIQSNLLHKGALRIGGQLVDLSGIRIPLLHACARHDHIVPYAAAKALLPAVGSADKEEVMLEGGHVSLVAGRHAVHRLWPRIEQWLSVRST